MGWLTNTFIFYACPLTNVKVSINMRHIQYYGQTYIFHINRYTPQSPLKIIKNFLHLVTDNKYFLFQFKMHINNKRYVISQDSYQFRTPQGKLRTILTEYLIVWHETWRLSAWISNPFQYHYVGVSNMETYYPYLFVNWKYLIFWENVTEVDNFLHML